MPGCAISASASAVTWVRALLQRVAERRRGELLGRPAGGRELAARALDVEIGDRDDMHAARQPRLRQEHGAELAGADQADGDGLAGGFAFEQEGVEVHRFIASRSTRVPGEHSAIRPFAALGEIRGPGSSAQTSSAMRPAHPIEA